MNAYGEHLIVKLPNKKKATDGGLFLPDGMGQQFCYGRVLSLGDQVHDPLGIDDVIVFDHLSARPLELDPAKDSDVLVIHETAVFGTITEAELADRKLPVP